jgi:hypothetical protein
MSLIGLSFFLFLLIVERPEIETNFSYQHFGLMVGIFLSSSFFVVQVFEDAKRNSNTGT